MKKLNLQYLLQLLVIVVAFAPLTTAAQQDTKEVYLRPSYFRPYDQRGLNVFETSKQADSIAYEGMRIRFGAGFTQQFQGLKHENSFTAPTNANRLYAMTPGFNTSMANLNLDVQLADGIRLNLVTYLSSRHHNEAWVKGGYIQFDKLPFKGKIWEDLMKVTTIRIGHMEVNYGDAHYRRSDGGQTIYNPFIENYILDAFTTEIGGEVLVQKNGLFAMAAVTNGMIKGNIDSLVSTEQDKNIHKSPALIFKGGFDRQLSDRIRVRVSGSYYHNGSSGGNTLYAGDRTGSNYFMAMEAAKVMDKATGAWVNNSAATSFASGRLNPGFSKKVDAIMVNGFVKFAGLELFGTYETAKGRTKAEVDSRQFDQIAGDILYRFGKNERVYVGARYNTAKGQLAGMTTDVTVNRAAFAAGWFLTRNILLKGEYVNQQYKDFGATDIRNGGKFNGYVIEAVVGF